MLRRRGCLVLVTIAAPLALFVGAPAGALAAAEEPVDGSTGGAAVEPSGDPGQPAAPPSTEWSPQGSEEGASSDGAVPLERGSSVGSGMVTEKAGPGSKAPSELPDSGASYQPEATVEESASTPRVESGVYSTQSRATETVPAATPSNAVDTEGGGAASADHPAPPQGDSASSAPPTEAASITDSGDGASSGSYALPLSLVVLVLGAILGYAYPRLRRRRLRRQREALWREQDAVWEAALRRAELGQVAGDSEPSAQPLQQVNAA